MLDTIAIKLERHSFKIHDPARFSPNAALFSSPRYMGRGVLRAVCNPVEKEKAQGYLPCLTLFKRSYGEGSFSLWLKIEFSAPKLIFGNNFEELAEHHFEELIDFLQKALNRMGVEVTKKALIEGKITAIHFSKNILLDRDTPCFSLMQILEKADIPRRLDVNRSLFRNGGQMITYHAKTFEIVLYDKMRDMEQAQKFGESRGAEKDYACPPSAHGRLKAEVLRIEVRLSSKKLKSLLSTLDIESGLTLGRLFCSRISRKILLHYWTEIVDGLYALNFEVSVCNDLADKIRAKFPRKRSSTVLALMGFAITCRQVGPRGARLLLGLSDSQFYRLKAEAKELGQDARDRRFLALNKVRAQLDKFIPLNRNDLVETPQEGFFDHPAQARA